MNKIHHSSPANIKITILRGLKDLLTHPKACQIWCDVMELRQRLYREQFPDALILDRYDLLADHVLLYSENGTPMAYVRSVTSQTCEKSGQPIPIETVVPCLPDSMRSQYSHFKERVKTAANMSYLCLDQNFKSELGGIKIIDFLTWIALRATDLPPSELGYCATPNAKYKLSSWLKLLGDAIPTPEPFIHPIVPEPHEMILIPQIQQNYWEEKTLLYQKFWNSANWIEPSTTRPKAA